MSPELYTDAEHDAEKALIGIALTWPDRFDELPLEPGHFHAPQWQHTWAAIREMREANEPIDILTVADKLEAMGWAAVKGTDLSACVVDVVTADNADHYVRIVRDGFVTRQVAEATGSVVEARKLGIGGDELLSLALEKLSAIDASQPDQSQAIGALIRERMLDLHRHMRDREEGKTSLTGVPTGIGELDGVIGGYQKGIVTIAAGRPGMGKSSLGMAAAEHGSRNDIGVHVFSLEDTRASYCDRAVAQGSKVCAESLRTGNLTRGEFDRISQASDRLLLRNHWLVDDRSGITADEIVRSVRRARRDNNTQLVVVDYIQLLKWPRGTASKYEAIGRNIDVLADAAKQDNIAYLVFSQLNRSCESREDKRPLLSDLRESGSLEERSKCVLMLYRDRVYNEAANDNEIELIVRKNSNGRANASVMASWHGPTTRIW